MPCRRYTVLTVTHDGFTPGDTIGLYVASTPILLGTGIADANGFVSINGTLPGDLEVGDHTIALIASDGVTGVAQAISIVADSNSGGLPTTGSDSRSMLIIAAALIGLGALGAYAARRRTRISL